MTLSVEADRELGEFQMDPAQRQSLGLSSHTLCSVMAAWSSDYSYSDFDIVPGTVSSVVVKLFLGSSKMPLAEARGVGRAF